MINRRLLGGRSTRHAYDAHTLAAWEFDSYETLLLDSVSGRRLGDASLEKHFYDSSPNDEGEYVRSWPNKSRLMSTAPKKFGTGSLRWCAHLAARRYNANHQPVSDVTAQSVELTGTYADRVPAAFTADFWIYFETANLKSSSLSIFETNEKSLDGLKLYYDSSNTTVTLKYKKSLLSSHSFTASCTPDAWSHIAMTSGSSGVKFFVNGVIAGSADTVLEKNLGSTFSVLMNTLALDPEDKPYGIYLDRLRFSDIERWTGSFTPPKEWEY